MICSYITNISLLVGAIFSWGVMWPLIRTKEGGWYESGLPSDSLQGIHGYRVMDEKKVVSSYFFYFHNPNL